MNMHQCPVLASIVVQQRHQDFRREAQREHVANVAASANMVSNHRPWTQLKGMAISIHAGSAHRLSCAARRVEIRYSAWRATPSGA
jgi:hypothetical protein